ncbi:hypothetical protein [Pyxidicoccus xibeiensis]|uniref:hypothetical protein n=1 Tax=Pyxidicoccus xibeiensis TaxID=2906759 RepID=UPI0020A7157F|nr:hypothetical protein [Pyxidicoccus xibeiensis]MCP3138956.1 hypothetical protein [Pyxidicoccus xibeiensis]
MNRYAPSRGSALVITLIALAVLLTMVVGVITFTGRNQAAAVAQMRGERVEACAETARQYVLSRLKAHGAFATRPIDVTLQEKLPDDQEEADRTIMRTSHLGSAHAPDGGPTTAELDSNSFGGANKLVSDATNTLRKGTGTGGFYRVVVMCDEPGGRQAETEFVFRFGI